jgi:nucleotide-binding universal stress UspA family protein
VLGFEQLGDVERGIPQRDKLATALQRDRIVEGPFPASINLHATILETVSDIRSCYSAVPGQGRFPTMSDGFRILVAVDFGGMDRVLVEVERQARAHDASITLLHVAQPDPEFMGYLKSGDPGVQMQTDVKRLPKAEALRTEHQQIQVVGDTLRDKGLRVSDAIAVQGPVLASILEMSHKLGADMLIMGSHQHGALYRVMRGDTAAEVVSQAPCPVLVVPS